MTIDTSRLRSCRTALVLDTGADFCQILGDFRKNTVCADSEEASSATVFEERQCVAPAGDKVAAGRAEDLS